MSENNENMNITASGSGKSPEEVAFDLVSKLKGQGVWGERNMDSILDMYAQCLDAAKGLRAYEGQNRVEVPIRKAKVAAPAPQQAAPRAQAPQTPPQAVQPQAAQPQTAQPVHAQQQQIQQAYKPA